MYLGGWKESKEGEGYLFQSEKKKQRVKGEREKDREMKGFGCFKNEKCSVKKKIGKCYVDTFITNLMQQADICCY